MTDADRIADLERQLGVALATITALAARVAELEARVAQNSSNSSQPPSSDPPSAPARPAATPTGRKPGGQPGHKGHHRRTRTPDHVVDHRPRACRGCRRRLRGNDPSPTTHQVTEVPPTRAAVTEHRLHALTCPDCGVATRATLPADVPRGEFGPRLQTFVGTLTGVYGVGKRDARALVNDWFGADLALGSVTTCERAVSAALAAPVAAAHDHVRAQAVIHADETSWREGRRRAWLWVAATTLVTVFLIHARRSQQAARALLGDFAGILVSDRWNAYNPWSLARRQLCWAHLQRHWVFISEWSLDETAAVGHALRAQTDAMFTAWHRVRDGTLTRAAFQTAMVPIRAEVERLLTVGGALASPKPSALCREVAKLRPALWTFVDVAGIEPTNNFAERQVRRGVLWRKRSFGTHSAGGSRFAERMLTTAATLRSQRRNITAFVLEALQAKLQGHPAPSLLPSTP